MRIITCLLCGRNEFTHKSPHKCVGGFRKRGLKWDIKETGPFKAPVNFDDKDFAIEYRHSKTIGILFSEMEDRELKYLKAIANEKRRHRKALTYIVLAFLIAVLISVY